MFTFQGNGSEKVTKHSLIHYQTTYGTKTTQQLGIDLGLDPKGFVWS